MLKPDFLKKLSDWAVDEYMKYPDILSKANKEFGMDTYFELRNTSAIDKDYSPCFAEFLTFDYKPKFLNHSTALEYFCKNNPLHIHTQELEIYKDLLNFEVGVFNIHTFVFGRGFYIHTCAGNKEIFVEDINLSLENIATPANMWIRICSVNGIWNVISATALRLPTLYHNGILQEYQEYQKVSLKSIFKVLIDKSEIGNDADNKEKIKEEGSKELFVNIRKKLRLTSLFTLEQFEKWARDKEYYGVNFCVKVLYYVIPEVLEGVASEEYFKIGSDYLNSIPKFYNNAKNTYERYKEDKTKPKVFDFNVYNRNLIGHQQEGAADFLYVGNYKKSIAEYKKLVTELFKTKTPTFPVFRIYANAANAYLASGDYDMAISLLQASLRMNKKYKFATNNLERILKMPNIEDGFSSQDLRYNKTVYAKYEKFMLNCGIDLNMDVEVKINNFKII